MCIFRVVLVTDRQTDCATEKKGVKAVITRLADDGLHVLLRLTIAPKEETPLKQLRNETN